MNCDAEIHFTIPPWVRWIAQDSSGVWWGYSVEPLRHDKGWYENEVGDYVRLGVTSAEDWENSLRKC
jgi:hypothetical protein